jgi:hypothetical protein
LVRGSAVGATRSAVAIVVEAIDAKLATLDDLCIAARGGVEHEELQTPAEQAWPAGQTLPQPPQFIASWLVPMQTPPHSDW